MLEVVIPGTRFGEAKISGDSAYRGCFGYISGVDADGYQQIKLPYDSSQAAKSFYPINKYRFEEDLSDTSDAVDKLTNGDMIVYYEGGEYITDKFDKSTFGLTAAYWDSAQGAASSAFGRKIYGAPGSSTAIASMGMDKIYVSTGDNTGTHGFAVGDPETIGFTGTSAAYIGFAVGLYFTDSSDAKLRIRLHPGIGHLAVQSPKHSNF